MMKRTFFRKFCKHLREMLWLWESHIRQDSNKNNKLNS